MTERERPSIHSVDDDGLTDRPLTPVGAVLLLSAWASVLAAFVQLALICGSPWIVLFHVSDAHRSVGHPSRVDRVVLLLPSLLGVVFSLVGIRGRRSRGVAIAGLVLCVLTLLLVRSTGFSE